MPDPEPYCGDPQPTWFDFLILFGFPLGLIVALVVHGA